MKTSTAAQKLSIATALAAISASSVATFKAEAAVIQLPDPYVLTGPGYITFDEVSFGANPPSPGNNYNDVFFGRDWIFPNPGDPPVINPNPAIGVNFAERFSGQQLSYTPNPATGPYDALSGTPTNPLTLQVGLPDQNVNISTSDKVFAGLGPLGFPNTNAIGEGATAILFPLDQTQFGFLLGGSAGSGQVTLKFFRRNGTLIDSITINSQNGDYGFETTQGDKIAGVSITNFEVGAGGMWIDNIVYDNPGTPPPPPENIPEPPSVLGLLAIAALGGSLKLKSKLKP